MNKTEAGLSWFLTRRVNGTVYQRICFFIAVVAFLFLNVGCGNQETTNPANSEQVVNDSSRNVGSGAEQGPIELVFGTPPFHPPRHLFYM